MKRKMLSEAEQQRIVDLHEAGWTLKIIAERMACSIGSVGWCCTKLGVVRKPKALGSRGPMLVLRNGQQVRRFSAEEDVKILQMREGGTPIAHIARALGRRQNSITGRLYTLARYQAAAE